MSTLLTAQSLHVDTAFGPLFQDLTFTLKKGDRMGLIGDNGCGKSTLLKILDGSETPTSGSVSVASYCHLARVEQHLPPDILSLPLREAVLAQLPERERLSRQWQAESILAEMGFVTEDLSLSTQVLSGGQHTRLLLARALMHRPDLLLLDEPGNHLDLPTLLWLEQFLQRWSGSFVVVSHDANLLDAVTNGTWILRDHRLHAFALPCGAARQALADADVSDALRRKSEQKEIDRVTASAKRLANWGRVYDNEDLSRKARQMEKQVSRLKAAQTDVTAGSQWSLTLQGDSVRADRLLEMNGLSVSPAPETPVLFSVSGVRLKSGDRVALVGRNGCGKSSLLRLLWQQFQSVQDNASVCLHPRVTVGYYDQTLQQLADNDSLFDALEPFAPQPDVRKMALIGAGFPWIRHQQQVKTLSGGERSRLLFVGLSLARFSLLMLDEPTNHLDMEGKEALANTLQTFSGGVLLVSHDRQLISQSCNRFWFIDRGVLSEWHDLEAINARIRETSVASAATITAQESAHPLIDDSDRLLEKLLLLERQLADDLARKPKHQKPHLQAQWRQEIDALISQLE
ncbi:ATP-binding cassette domain-containing protein [Citrobacter sp. Awk 4]|uniref:ABC-F family ATP-binding cassette domain-containing protein n=1 Tax=Citrobacter sp. Awk 4 TaxID=2963955 RepID=UPI0023046135|nr:ABC-F family ATP-binding cassette domain-containing protein [Citrobacter sp. Awk 4]MDA8480238.1 ATP-binding cassette domain-containing protein [Citrobacter sp. Awk 4]